MTQYQDKIKQHCNQNQHNYQLKILKVFQQVKQQLQSHFNKIIQKWITQSQQQSLQVIQMSIKNMQNNNNIQNNNKSILNKNQQEILLNNVRQVNKSIKQSTFKALNNIQNIYLNTKINHYSSIIQNNWKNSYYLDNDYTVLKVQNKSKSLSLASKISKFNLNFNNSIKGNKKHKQKKTFSIFQSAKVFKSKSLSKKGSSQNINLQNTLLANTFSNNNASANNGNLFKNYSNFYDKTASSTYSNNWINHKFSKKQFQSTKDININKDHTNKLKKAVIQKFIKNDNKNDKNKQIQETNHHKKEPVNKIKQQFHLNQISQFPKTQIIQNTQEFQQLQDKLNKKQKEIDQRIAKFQSNMNSKLNLILSEIKNTHSINQQKPLAKNLVQQEQSKINDQKPKIEKKQRSVAIAEEKSRISRGSHNSTDNKKSKNIPQKVVKQIQNNHTQQDDLQTINIQNKKQISQQSAKKEQQSKINLNNNTSFIQIPKQSIQIQRLKNFIKISSKTKLPVTKPIMQIFYAIMKQDFAYQLQKVKSQYQFNQSKLTEQQAKSFMKETLNNFSALLNLKGKQQKRERFAKYIKTCLDCINILILKQEKQIFIQNLKDQITKLANQLEYYPILEN